MKNNVKRIVAGVLAITLAGGILVGSVAILFEYIMH